MVPLEFHFEKVHLVVVAPTLWGSLHFVHQHGHLNTNGRQTRKLREAMVRLITVFTVSREWEMLFTYFFFILKVYLLPNGYNNYFSIILKLLGQNGTK